MARPAASKTASAVSSGFDHLTAVLDHHIMSSLGQCGVEVSPLQVAAPQGLARRIDHIRKEDCGDHGRTRSPVGEPTSSADPVNGAIAVNDDPHVPRYVEHVSAVTSTAFRRTGSRDRTSRA
jgi:hypothetical protein